MVVVAQTPEVVEGDQLQVWPGESGRQLLADGFEDADSRQFLDALGKGFLFSLGLLLRRRLVAGHAIVNVAFLGVAEIENAASALAVNENGGFRVGAFSFCLGPAVLPFIEHVFCVAVCLPRRSLRDAQRLLAFLLKRLHLNLYEGLHLCSVAFPVSANGCSPWDFREQERVAASLLWTPGARSRRWQ